MPLSKHHIDTQETEIPVDFHGIKSLLESQYPQILFALVMGSASEGTIAKYSDLDVAVYLEKKGGWELLSSVMQSIGDLHQGVRCDVGVLNNAEPVYCYEALKGKLLFTRDQERWLTFYSVTCREYETQIFHYQKQLQYRLLSDSNVF